MELAKVRSRFSQNLTKAGSDFSLLVISNEL